MTRIAVIGAGLSGLVAARLLQQDHDVTVFERSRGVFGCGGILSKSMARLGAKVTGIDVVEKNIAIASLNAAQQGRPIDYQLCTASELADSSASC